MRAKEKKEMKNRFTVRDFVIQIGIDQRWWACLFILIVQILGASAAETLPDEGMFLCATLSSSFFF